MLRVVPSLSSPWLAAFSPDAPSRRPWRSFALIAGALVLVAGCSQVPGAGDAGPRDGEVADTGLLDVGLLDTGLLDTGLLDTGVGDGSGPDAGSGVPCAAGARFCNRAPEMGLWAGLPGYGRGSSWVDVDGDGWEDLWQSDSGTLYAAHPGHSMLWRSLAGEGFEPMDIGLPPEALRYNWMATWADIDRDSDPDLLLTNGGYTGVDRVWLFRNDLESTGGFTDITPLSGLSAEIAAWWSGSFVDHDRDGELDLVLTRIDGDPLLYRGLGAGRFEEIVGAFRSEIVLPVVDNKGPVWFDYDLDGDEDLYVAGMSSARLFRNDGAGLFVDVSAELLPPEARRWVFAASAADLDQDGDEDLYLGCWSNQDYVLVNEGGTFSMQGPGLGLDMQVGDESHENTMGLTIGDIDGDGFPDVLIGPGDPSFRGPPIAYCHEGVGLGFRRCSEDFVAGHGSSRNHGASLGDPDHDGDVDIFWNLGGNPPYDTETGEDSTQLPAYYVQQGAPIATTVSVRLRGTESNVEALGASIRIEGGSTRWLTLHSTQGFPNQPSPWRVLSLSGASTGTLTIRWPSGRVSMRTVSAFERIEIVE